MRIYIILAHLRHSESHWYRLDTYIQLYTYASARIYILISGNMQRGAKHSETAKHFSVNFIYDDAQSATKHTQKNTKKRKRNSLRNPKSCRATTTSLTLFPVDCFIMLKTVELKCVIWHNPLTKIEHEFIMFSHFFGTSARICLNVCVWEWRV